MSSCPPVDRSESSDRLHSMRLFIAGMLTALATGANQIYSCQYDCHLFKGQGSTRGYFEYLCDSAVTNCCSWQACVPPLAFLYRNRICPTTASELPERADGIAVFRVGVNSSEALDFPRNSHFVTTGETRATCPSVDKACMPGCRSAPAPQRFQP